MPYRTVSIDPPGYDDRVVVENDKGQYVTNAQVQFGIFAFGSLDQAATYTREGGRDVVRAADKFGHHKLRIVRMREEKSKGIWDSSSESLVDVSGNDIKVGQKVQVVGGSSSWKGETGRVEFVNERTSHVTVQFGNEYIGFGDPKRELKVKTFATPKSERRRSLGDWFRKALVVRKDVNSEATGAQGGFLVPPQWRVGIDELIAELSFFHRHSTVVPMTGVELHVPTVDPAAAAAGGSPLFGGFTMYWQGINDYTAPTTSNPVFEDAVIEALNLGGWGYVSNQLLEDGGEELGAYLETIVARATAFYITKACFVGAGMLEPVGVVNAPGSSVVTRTGSGALVAADFSNMQKKLLPACYAHAWWCVSPSAYSQLSGLTGFFPIMTDEEGAVGWYRGFPVFVTEALPVLGTKGDVVLLDPRLFALGERQEIEVQWAKEGPVAAYAANQSVIRAWWRGGGALTWRTTATAANGETTVSPCVVLNT